jgi:hypothetical protein
MQRGAEQTGILIDLLLFNSQHNISTNKNIL